MDKELNLMRNQSECFNTEWKFRAGTFPRFESLELDDSDWEAVDLPHDWSISGEFDAALPHGRQHAYLPNGVVNYRKHFRIEPDDGERVLLDFDGAYRSADLFVNGRHILKHLNGYTGFEADITEALLPGENLVAVRVDNSIERTSRWYTGTGINRSVRLRRIREMHFARHGLRIDARIDGTVRISAEPVNGGRVEHTITAPDGSSPATLSGRDVVWNCPAPELWSPDTPNLYSCVSRLIDDEHNELDRIEARFGFRSIEFSPEQGLIFNGKKLLLRGVNLHEDLCGIGTAIFREGIARRFRILKSLGVNAIRLAHHPYAPEYLELADEMGLLIFAEAFDKWTGQYYGWQKTFESAWREDLREFIRRDRNHPSIFLWSVGNEVVDQQLEGEDDFGVDRLREMREFVKQLDPTRCVTCALYPSRRDGVRWDNPGFRSAEIHQMAFHMDVVSANYMGEFFAEDHRKHPEMVFLMSEATTNRGAGSWFSFDHKIAVGSFYWGGFDYLGEACWPHKNWYSGLVDRAGFPKSAAFQSQIAWEPRPRIHVSVHVGEQAEIRNWNDVQLEWEEMRPHWNWTPGQTLRLAVYTNCEEAELLLNGRTVGRKSRTADDCCRIPFELVYEPGELLARGFNGGEIAAETVLRTAGRPAALQLTAVSGTIPCGEIGHAEIELVDAAGIRCADRKIPVRLRVDGTGYLFGVTNGDTTGFQRFRSNTVWLHEGRALAVVRGGRTPGECRLHAFTDDLEAELPFQVVQPQ